MDLMIEAKDKEQSVFELMRTFKLPGWETFNNIIPYERGDDNKPLPKKAKKKKTKKQIAAEMEEFGKELSEEEEVAKEQIPEDDIGMGGVENRVYWPPGMEEWLRPKKREVKKKGGDDEEEIFKNPTPENFAARKAVTARNKTPLSDAAKEKLRDARCVADIQKILEEIMEDANAAEARDDAEERPATKKSKTTPARKIAPAKKKAARNVPTPSISNIEDDEEEDLSMPDLSAEEDETTTKVVVEAAVPTRQSIRAIGKRKSYAEDNGDFSETE
jgi:UV DNA damage endonuclease